MLCLSKTSVSVWTLYGPGRTCSSRLYVSSVTAACPRFPFNNSSIKLAAVFTEAI